MKLSIWVAFFSLILGSGWLWLGREVVAALHAVIALLLFWDAWNQRQRLKRMASADKANRHRAYRKVFPSPFTIVDVPDETHIFSTIRPQCSSGTNQRRRNSVAVREESESAGPSCKTEPAPDGSAKAASGTHMQRMVRSGSCDKGV